MNLFSFISQIYTSLRSWYLNSNSTLNVNWQYWGSDKVAKAIRVYLVVSDAGYFGFMNWLKNVSSFPSKYVEVNRTQGTNFSYVVPKGIPFCLLLLCLTLLPADFYYLFFFNYNHENVSGKINLIVSSMYAHLMNFHF